ncbi:hypothetical protein [Fusobacterium sp.]|uniref:hypothetical protein n=1 Tax=Fusobacterium sp. TaxID=68766 RepID=UPI0025BA12E6|nr:hypothetical protein [Fusobacterium sp.]
MKKLLLGSMLVLGATSFGAVVEDLQNNGAKPAVLNIRVKGTVVDPTKYSLIVKPLDATNTTDTMQFNFDGLTIGEEQIVEGGYSAGVYQNNILITDDYKIETSLKRNGQNATTSEYDQMAAAKLAYSLGEPQAVGREYRGKVNVKATGKAKGSFVDNGVNLEVLVKNI